MTVKMIGVLCGATLALSACAGGVEVTTPPQAVNFTSATARANVHSQDPITIRAMTVVKAAGKTTRNEISGAACSLQGTGFSAKFVTPAKVTIPTYKGRTDPVKVTCKANGKTVSKTFSAINLTTTQTTYSTGGIVGALVTAAATAAIRAARNPANDIFAYSAMSVNFTTTPPKAAE